MTNEQINIAIAEACGWQFVTYKETFAKPPNGDWQYKDKIPDYCNDLNAMHEAWLSLSDKDKFVCDKELMRVLVASKDGPYWMTNSTAKQRAEAFLKAIGKWKD
jgi:hypothetical protein